MTFEDRIIDEDALWLGVRDEESEEHEPEDEVDDNEDAS